MEARHNFIIGDIVSVINDTMTGRIVKIDKEIITIECADGFLYPFQFSELVPLTQWGHKIDHNVDHFIEYTMEPKKDQFKVKKVNIVKEVDLHIHELIESERGMTNYDKLSLQVHTAKKELEIAIEKKQSKIIFIHGRGAGVLKKELRKLFEKYPVDFHDASYTDYGIGATEVIIFQHKK